MKITVNNIDKQLMLYLSVLTNKHTAYIYKKKCYLNIEIKLNKKITLNLKSRFFIIGEIIIPHYFKIIKIEKNV